MDGSGGSGGAREAQRSIMDWDEDDVHAFLCRIGFPQYEAQIRGAFSSRFPFVIFLHSISYHGWALFFSPTLGNNITGDILVELGAEELKEVGITTVGQRLGILKAVYHVKLSHGIPIQPHHYVPPCKF